MTEYREQLSSIWADIKESLRLNVDYAKLTAAEKLTMLLSMIGVAMICLVLGSIVIFMVSLGLLMLLAKSAGLFGACMIMAGVFAVILVVAVLLRRQLVVDPIARFLSNLLLK